jgi:hypothetical protein
VRALLVIADIGGYTRFMRVHRVNLAHAQWVVAQLLESLIDAGEPKLKLAKLEGDAAFFYAPMSDEPKPHELHVFEKRINDLRHAFLRKRGDLEKNPACNCDGCSQAGQLKLKFVAHLGEVMEQRVKRYRELAGVDVIFVHRLLKNKVPVPEYVLMSEPVVAGIHEDFKRLARPTLEQLEGLGEVTTHYVDFDDLVLALPEPEPASFWRRAWLWLRANALSIPYILGFRRACEGFRNMGDVDPSLAPPDELPPASTGALASFQTMPPPPDTKS